MAMAPRTMATVKQVSPVLYPVITCSYVIRFRHHPEVSRQLTRYEERVIGGHMTPGTAADHLIEQFMKTIIINATT